MQRTLDLCLMRLQDIECLEILFRIVFRQNELDAHTVPVGNARDLETTDAKTALDRIV